MSIELAEAAGQQPLGTRFSIHLHGAGNERAETITVDIDQPIAMFIGEYRDSEGRSALAISLVEEDADLDPSRSWRDHGIRNGHRVHGHRCRTISVTVDYAGRASSKEFRANRRVARVKEAAVHDFTIPAADAADLVLAYGNPLAPINEDLHVGDLVRADCKVTLQLVRADYFNG